MRKSHCQRGKLELVEGLDMPSQPKPEPEEEVAPAEEVPTSRAEVTGMSTSTTRSPPCRKESDSFDA
jgi:hypothetical protein